jgi:glutamine transport system substrate-binding protein
MKSGWILSFVLLCAVTLISCGQKAWETLSRIEKDKMLWVGTDATYPPFETISTATGQPEGLDIDLVRAVAKKLGWQVGFVVTPFDGIVPGLNGKKYDMIVSSFTITPERAAAVQFSIPYYDAGQSIAVPLDNTTITRAEDLKGKKVGVQLGTTGERMAKSIDSVEVISFENIGAAFIDMENGKLDAVLNDLPTSTKIVNTRQKAKIVARELSDEKYGMAVRKEDTALVAKINSALTDLKKEGLIEQLQQKWFAK